MQQLLSSAYEIFSKIVLNRLKVYIEEYIEDHQAGPRCKVKVSGEYTESFEV